MLHLLILSTLLSLSHAQSLNYSVHYQWNYLNYTWPSPTPSVSYIPKHNVLAGVKVWKDRVYITIPRFLPGVPVTLASVPKTSDSLSPLLEPYPNWEMQREDNCSALTYVQGFEIDTEGRMWVISNGRVELWTNQSRVLCPSRLLIFDLEDNGKVLLDYAFPDSIAEPPTVFLNDIVVDQEDGGFAYITDSDPQHPGLIVFSLREGRSWKFNHPSMQLHEEAVHFIINGTKYDTRLAINGIALSQASMKGNSRLLYYCPLASFELFSVPTWVLKSRVVDIGPHVVTVGRKESQVGGMIMSNTGTLYSGLMALDGVAAWNTSQPPFTKNHHLVIQNHTLSQHPDSLAIEATGGRLWYTANRLQLYHTDTADINEPNLRIIVAEIGAKSYLYYEDGSAPEAPKIPSGGKWTPLTPLLTIQQAFRDLIKSIF